MSFPWKRCLCSGAEVNVKCVRAASALNDGFREASSDVRAMREREAVFSDWDQDLTSSHHCFLCIYANYC